MADKDTDLTPGEDGTQVDTPESNQPSPLGMSDADFLNAPPPSAVEAPAATELPDEGAGTNADDKAPSDVPDPDEGDDGDGADGADTTQGEGNDGTNGKQAEGDAAGSDGKDKDKKPEEDKGTQPPKKDDKKPEDTAPEAQVNFEAEYKKLLAPFKANGRDITVKSVDDAIVLMQMGANYNKRMASLKPNLKMMRMLENSGFLSEDKISFLIDVGNKNPEAISKLISEAELNPMDLDAEKANGYKATTQTVSDTEIELDNVLETLQETPTYTKLLETVSKKWDGSSKQVIASTPQLLQVINDHMGSGIYDVINSEVESERMLGRLKGLSDIEAYRQVGDAIQARGGFNHLIKGSSHDQGQPTAKPAVVVPNPKKEEDDKLKDKRRAASTTKAVAPKTGPQDFNPLGMSDAEFMKLAEQRFS